MRGAEMRMQKLREVEVVRQREALKHLKIKLNSVQLHKSDEARCVIEQVDAEISKRSARVERTRNITKRLELSAAIEHLRELREEILGKNRRKPPESGLSVPAVPPRGPAPKQGGAAAALDFGQD